MKVLLIFVTYFVGHMSAMQSSHVAKLQDKSVDAVKELTQTDLQKISGDAKEGGEFAAFNDFFIKYKGEIAEMNDPKPDKIVLVENPQVADIVAYWKEKDKEAMEIMKDYIQGLKTLHAMRHVAVSKDATEQ